MNNKQMNKSLEALIDEAKQSASIMEYIASFEPQDIDGDDVELRFEIDDVDTGTDVSLVEQCGKASSALTALIAALEQAQQEKQQWVDLANRLGERVYRRDHRISELEHDALRLNSIINSEANRADAAQQRAEELESLCVNPDAAMRGVEPLCVKLPEYRNSPDMHTKQYYEAIGFNQGLDAAAESIRAAGGTVGGE